MRAKAFPTASRRSSFRSLRLRAHVFRGFSTVNETGSLGTGSYTLSKTVTGASYTLVEGNSLTGDYTSDITAPSTRTSAETSNDTVTSIFTETETDAPTTVETGNSIDGSYTQTLTNTILTTDSIN